MAIIEYQHKSIFFGWPIIVVQIISMLLRVNPGERLGALGMEEVRRHPWFKSLNWKGETLGIMMMMIRL